jgi:hypothetical protein
MQKSFENDQKKLLTYETTEKIIMYSNSLVFNTPKWQFFISGPGCLGILKNSHKNQISPK